MQAASPASSSVSPLRGLPNFRDLGGPANAEGRRVRSGKVFRSEVLSPLSTEDRATLSGLQIRSVFDLRNPSECVATPSAWPLAIDGVAVHVMPEELQVPGADMRQLVKRMRDASLQVDQVGEIMRTTYRAMPAHFAPMLNDLFKALAEGEGGTLIHCTAGKDRTGFISAMVLHALDVPVESIRQDYLVSARAYSVERLLAQMERVAGQTLDPKLGHAMAAMAQVDTSYLELALQTIERDWGSTDAYLREQAGLDDARRALLRERLLM